MNELPDIYDRGAEQTLGPVSLEEVRAKSIRIIESNLELSSWQRRAMIEEIDFLIEHEKLRRLRRFAFQWIDERVTMRNKLVLRQIELANSIRVSNRQTALQIAKIDKDILSCKLDVIERLRNLRPESDASPLVTKILPELEKIRLQSLVVRAKEKMLHRNLTERTLNRQTFVEKVREQYPDMADELIEQYDRQIVEQTRRR